MKKMYVTPVMSMTKFELNDIITASGENPAATYKASDLLTNGGESSTVDQAIQFSDWK